MLLSCINNIILSLSASAPKISLTEPIKNEQPQSNEQASPQHEHQQNDSAEQNGHETEPDQQEQQPEPEQQQPDSSNEQNTSNEQETEQAVIEDPEQDRYNICVSSPLKFVPKSSTNFDLKIAGKPCWSSQKIPKISWRQKWVKMNWKSLALVASNWIKWRPLC